MLLNKPVQIIGRSHYEGADELDLAVYIQRYLLDIDFFSKESITDEQFGKILGRLKLC
jgi:hypothetical protein